MSAGFQIIANGGWRIYHRFGRPKTRLCAFLSIVWLPVGAVAVFLGSSEARVGFGWWPYGLAVVAEIVFLALAIVFWLTEKPRPIREEHANSTADPRHLH